MGKFFRLWNPISTFDWLSSKSEKQIRIFIQDDINLVRRNLESANKLRIIVRYRVIELYMCHKSV